MHLEVLVEEASMAVALQSLLPRLIGHDHGFRILQFSGSLDLLKQLPARLRGYRKWIPDDYRIIVVTDRDRKDCLQLKARLEAMAVDAGLPTKTHPDRDGGFLVVNRIAIEELEAWFFGDVEAIAAAYPKVRASVVTREKYNYPDEIRGGTWEALHRVLREFGYYRGVYPKIEVAASISRHMDPDRNSSPSFACFVQGVRACLS